MNDLKKLGSTFLSASELNSGATVLVKFQYPGIKDLIGVCRYFHLKDMPEEIQAPEEERGPALVEARKAAYEQLRLIKPMAKKIKILDRENCVMNGYEFQQISTLLDQYEFRPTLFLRDKDIDTILDQPSLRAAINYLDEIFEQ